MERKHLDIFDTTLRDGSQGEGVNFSLAGWMILEFQARIQKVKEIELKHSKRVAFGSAAEDPNLNKLIESGWDLHVNSIWR